MTMGNGSLLNQGHLDKLGYLEKVNKMTRLEIRQKIVSILFDIDNYKQARMIKKVRQLENTIEYLEYMLQNKNLKDK